MTDQYEELFAKIRMLSPEKVAAVDDFVEYLISKDKVDHLTWMLKLSEESIQKAWDNSEDAEYDKL